MPIIFILPVVQLILLAYAATLEIKNIEVMIVDKDLSQTSRQLTGKFKGSPFFKVVASSFSVKEGVRALEEDKAEMIINIPSGFEKKLIREDESKMQLIINAINGTVAGISNAYATAIISGFNRNILLDWYKMPEDELLMKNIDVTYSYWFNPDLNYQTYMVPGILVILVTIIGMFLTGLNLVREKEMGTVEQINVTPIRKSDFIIGKLLPFWIIALFDLTLGLIIGKIIFDIPMVGSIWLLYGVASVYLVGVLGIGLFISTVSSTQQQVMFLSFFFLLVFVLMSGVFTSVETMPQWARWLNRINPLFYFMKIIRMIMLKGSDFRDILPDFSALGVYGVLMLSLAVWKYRKIAA